MQLGRWKCRSIILLWLIGSLLGCTNVWGRTFPATGDPALADQQRWGAGMQGYVALGCLHALSGSTSVSMPNCRAFVLDPTASPPVLQGIEDLTARTITYSGGDGTYWLVLRSDIGVVPSSYTCVAGTHYCWLKSSTRPTSFPAKTLLIGVSTVSANTITVAGDLRPDSPVPTAPVSLRSPIFGAVGTCTTDDTAAIHAWYANAQWRKRPAYAPAGCYNFTRWAVIYDATYGSRLPPNVPASTLNWGDLEVSGDGAMGVDDYANNAYHGTVFVSTDATGPGLFGDSSADSTNPLRNLRLKDFSITANNGTAVVDVRGFNSNAEIEGVAVFQKGNAGDGLILDDAFLINLKRVFVSHDDGGAGLAVGTGIHFRHEDRTGGILNLDNVTARGWGGGTCIGFGHGTVASAAQINTINAFGVQALLCHTGMRVAAGVAAFSLIGGHIEQCSNTGLFAYNASRGITILGSFFGNDASVADVHLGDPALPASDEEANGVTIIGNIFQSVDTIGILREVSAEMTGFNVIGNVFTPDTNGQGVAIQCGATVTIQRAAFLAGNWFPATTSPTKFQFQTRNCAQVELEVGSTWTRVGGGLAVTRTPANEAADWVPPAAQIQELMTGTATLDFAVIVANTCSELTFALTGATTGDVVSLSVPAAAFVANIAYSARVSAVDTIAVRACNVATVNSADPGSGTFRVSLTRFE